MSEPTLYKGAKCDHRRGGQRCPDCGAVWRWTLPVEPDQLRSLFSEVVKMFEVEMVPDERTAFLDELMSCVSGAGIGGPHE